MEKRSQLTNSDLDFLVNAETLRAWAGQSLAERCALFHRQDISKAITPSQLRRIYRQHSVRKKVCRFVKVPNPNSKRRWEITEEGMLR